MNTSQSAPWLVVGVISAIKHLEARRLIRATWLSPKAFRQAGQVVALFVIGESDRCSSVREQRLLAREARAHGDMLLLDGVSDCQANFGMKTHQWYRHAVKNWPAARWICKAEDDAIVDLAAVQELLFALQHADTAGNRADNGRKLWYVGRFAWTAMCWPLRAACPKQLRRPGLPHSEETRAA
eukprot:596846-Prymnesium_polylepis.3